MSSRLALGVAVVVSTCVLASGWEVYAVSQDGEARKSRPVEREKAGAKAKDPSADKAKNKADKPAKTAKATFGGGCFWCLEAFFERVIGVKDVVSGYAGGHVRKPTYDMVLAGLTGHAEVVQIEYDPEVVTYEELLKVFWACHDPTSLNAQGPDVGTQYRSIILYHDDAQREAAEKSKQAIDTSGILGRPIVTEIVPLRAFYKAEAYHQDYFRKHKYAAYCQAYIVPKLQMLQAKFGEKAEQAKKP